MDDAIFVQYAYKEQIKHSFSLNPINGPLKISFRGWGTLNLKLNLENYQNYYDKRNKQD